MTIAPADPDPAATFPPATRGGGPADLARAILIGLACVATGVVADALFLPHQTLWQDEVTQMTGLALGPVDGTKWLMNKLEPPTWEPKDRMPPLSYWAGWAWSRAFGLDERSMRWFGVACVSAATAVVFASARSAWGTAAGASAALLLATSPNVVTTAVEIRAYPALILMAAGVFACLVGYAVGPIGSRGRWLAGMTACGIASMYLHFFGLVALGGALVAAFVLAVARKEGVGPTILGGAVAGLAALGLAPFVMTSFAMPDAPRAGPSAGDKLASLVVLGYRSFSHPATSMSTVAVALAGLGFGLGIACGLAPKRRSGLATIGLAVAIASGLAVVALAQLAQSSFRAASVNYNVWTLPPLMMVVASGLAARAGAVRLACSIAIALTLGTNAYAVAQLAAHGGSFAHTSAGPVADLVRGEGLGRTAVVYDDDGPVNLYFALYAPLRHEFGTDLRQFVAERGEPAGRVLDLLDSNARVDLASLGVDRVVVVVVGRARSAEIAARLRGEGSSKGDGPLARALLASGDWERVRESSFVSFFPAEVDVFRRKVAGP